MFSTCGIRSLSLHALCLTVICVVVGPVNAQIVTNSKYGQLDKFRQLEELLPTPGDTRTASGAPGSKYWQQQADYEIDVQLDDDKQKITGRETIVYTNNSPDSLRYLWLQLDSNMYAPHSSRALTGEGPDLSNNMQFEGLDALLNRQTFDGSTKIISVLDAASQKPLHYEIVRTNMRVDLPEALPPGGVFRFEVSWEYNVHNGGLQRGRCGYEYFEKDKNYIYEIAQWFPRLCAYTDVTGWNHKEYLGAGEFTLEFGNYLVRINVPEDHIVASTGALMNATEVLTVDQQQRLQTARTSPNPVFVVTPAEALENQRESSTGRRTWIFKADNVRDFAFASSRKFIWDAQGHDSAGNPVMAMSYYPNEAEPLWSKYSTRSIVHTLNIYSRYTFQYPYPVAISVNGPAGGMEYPMICFNGPRPEEDGTYSARTKYGLISVVIHEVGHNYFPMIVNTDERQWTWMDEGLNTFLQYLSEVEWEEDYPARRGEPKDITAYMKSTNQVPIMTNSESVLQFGNNAYAKPATALNILRETILGRELFDFAFREYARRWMFRRPYPADFFRSMEDASGIDLDWFWHGWFYTTDHVDVEVAGVHHFELSDGNPDIEKSKQREKREAAPKTLSEQRNAPLPKLVDQFPDLKDFYNSFDELNVTDEDRKTFQRLMERLSAREKELIQDRNHFYVVQLKNVGGLVTPVILKLNHADGSSTEHRLPAELWRMNNQVVFKLLISTKEVTSVELDPHLEMADVDRSNNYFPPQIESSRFKLFQERKERNEMQKAGLGKKDPEAKEENKDVNP